MKDSEIKNFSLLPVTILSSFGHNGLDWIHSLLDGHDEIVLMPPNISILIGFYQLKNHSIALKKGYKRVVRS